MASSRDRTGDTKVLERCFALLEEARPEAPLTPARLGALKSQLELLVLEASEDNQDEIREVIAEPLEWLKTG